VSCSSRYGPVFGSCESGYKLLDFMKGCTFADYLSYNKLLQKGFSPYIWVSYSFLTYPKSQSTVFLKREKANEVTYFRKM
jgi:hypothetical protein